MNATQPSAEVSELLMAHLNKRAVFCDSGVLGLVVVEEIKLGPRSLRLRLQLHDLVMLANPSKFGIRRRLTVGAVWEDMVVQQDVWIASGQGCSWRLVPSELSFAAVRRFCAEEPKLNPDVRFYLARYVANHPAIDGIPEDVRAEAFRWVERANNRQ
jgi:hypothetical protein